MIFYIKKYIIIFISKNFNDFFRNINNDILEMLFYDEFTRKNFFIKKKMTFTMKFIIKIINFISIIIK